MDTCATNRKTLRIAGDDKPAEVVRSRFMKLNADHIRFVLKCLAENSSPIRNMKQYLLASLYNAPTTMQLTYYPMIIHEEPSPNSVSSPVSTAKDSRCYTVEDLMEMLLLSRPTVYRLLKQNEFRWFKVSGAYRISKASFEAWLNDGTVERNPAV